jgi:hypothetical protein
VRVGHVLDEEAAGYHSAQTDRTKSDTLRNCADADDYLALPKKRPRTPLGKNGFERGAKGKNSFPNIPIAEYIRIFNQSQNLWIGIAWLFGTQDFVSFKKSKKHKQCTLL